MSETLQERASILGVLIAPEKSWEIDRECQTFDHDEIELQDYDYTLDEISWVKRADNEPEVAFTLKDEEFSSPYEDGDVVISKHLYKKLQCFIQYVKESKIFMLTTDMQELVEIYQNMNKTYPGTPTLIIESRWDELMQMETELLHIKKIVCK